jgi:tRNA threonylcarbamoyladenosine biosynthesis protein TsaE
MNFVTHSVEETIALGEAIGRTLNPGMTLTLDGELGTGKTHLTKGVAAGLGVERPETVNSPTFVLLQVYHGRVPLYHFDCYRLSDPGEFLELGYEEFLEDGICVIEWGERVSDHLATPRLEIRLERGAQENERHLTVTPIPEGCVEPPEFG